MHRMGVVVETPVRGRLIVRVAGMLRCLDLPKADVPDDTVVGAGQIALIRRLCDVVFGNAVDTHASAGSHTGSGRTLWLYRKGNRMCCGCERVDDALAPRCI